MRHLHSCRTNRILTSPGEMHFIVCGALLAAITFSLWADVIKSDWKTNFLLMVLRQEGHLCGGVCTLFDISHVAGAD
jgi:hypothetical protein